ncbi:hypothetical protein BHE74_00030742 [Ensete ventricosum]|nr:hypothetical protein BHE74_00030742 [Ensete ventricosum]
MEKLIFTEKERRHLIPSPHVGRKLAQGEKIARGRRIGIRRAASDLRVLPSPSSSSPSSSFSLS